MPRGERSSGNHAGLSRSRSRRTGGLPVIGRRPGRAAIAGARFGVFFTAAAWLGYVVEQTIRLRGTDLTPRTLGEA
ncbi:MAG: hypothetical protein ACE5EF_13965, partial [Dehalococcoidia bacterium]